MSRPSARRMYFTCTLLFLLAIPAFSSAGSCSTQQKSREKGIVIGLTQDLTDGSQELTLGSCVQVEATISPTPKTAKTVNPQALTVWFEGHRPNVYPCHKDQSPDCDENNRTKIFFPVSDSPRPKTFAEKIPDALMAVVAKVLPEAPSRYFSAASRGLEGEVKEAVVPLQGSQVDIAAALNDLSAGMYSVRFESLGEIASNPIAAQVRWQPSQPALVPKARLRPGLYRLTLLEGPDEPEGSEAWILLSGPQKYSTDAGAFQGVQDTIASWPKSADPMAIRAVLRASLEALSQQKENPALL
jgi:hypothetical protein